MQVTRLDVGAEQPGDLLGERQGCLRRRVAGRVGGHRRPQRRRGDARLAAGHAQHADDAGGALVAGTAQLQALGQLLVVGGAVDRHRAGVRHIGQQRPEGHDEPRLEVLGDAEHVPAERRPAEVRLDPLEDDHVGVAAGHATGRETVRGPGEVPPAVVVEVHERAGDGEVEELLGVQLGEGGGAPLLHQVLGRAGGGVAGVVPAAEGGEHHGPLEARAPRPADFGEIGCG